MLHLWRGRGGMNSAKNCEKLVWNMRPWTDSCRNQTANYVTVYKHTTKHGVEYSELHFVSLRHNLYVIWNENRLCFLGFLVPPPPSFESRNNSWCRTYVHLQYSTRWRSWLRHYGTNRNVAGSIPDGVFGIFHSHNPFGRTMALGSTQPLTEMSTRNIFWGVKAAGA
jgi:hypothetical protein